MPQVRKLLGACTVEIAARRRICHRDRKNHTIEKGAACLVIKGAASTGKKTYCLTCALAILDQAATDLDALRAGLS